MNQGLRVLAQSVQPLIHGSSVALVGAIEESESACALCEIWLANVFVRQGLSDADVAAYEKETQMGHMRTSDDFFASHGASSRSLCPGMIGHTQFSTALPACAVGYKPTEFDTEVKDEDLFASRRST